MTALQALFVDLAVQDGVTPAQVGQLGATGAPWSGAIFQCSNGLSMGGAWFSECWNAAGGRAIADYGTAWFRGAYAYLRVDESGSQQADIALSAVDAAGGWDVGDLWMGVDIERGEQPANATAAQVEAVVTAFAKRILEKTGKRPMLYAGSYTRDLGIKSRMGCALLWFPQWSSVLNWATVTRMGFDENTTLLWQDVGDGSNTAPLGYPHTTPIGDNLDISILVRANLPYAEGVEWLRTHIGAQPT